MIRESFRILIILIIVLGNLGNTSSWSMASPAETDSPTMSVEEFVHQIYFEGTPYSEAAKYGPENVSTLLAMLKDPNEKPYWSNIVVTLGAIGDDRAVDPLIGFLEQKGDSLTREEFLAQSSVLMSLGYLINKSKNEKALSYLKAHIRPKEWEDSNLARAPGFQASTDQLTQQLSTLAIIGLALSGHPSARDTLNSLNEDVRAMDPTPFASQMNSVVGEALQAHDTIATEGLDMYYKKSKR